MYARRSRWIPTRPDALAELVDDPTRWAVWLPVAEAGTDGAPGVLHAAGRPVEVAWRHAATTGGVRTWEARRDDRVLATLRITLAPWDGGTQAQVEVERTGRRRGAWWTGELLADALHRLERHAAVHPRPARVRRVSPSVPHGRPIGTLDVSA